MSHVTTVDLEVLDLDALETAAKSLGLELARGQQTYRWYGRHVGDYALPPGFTADDMGKCDHAIRIPGNDKAYEIGVVRRRGGPGFVLLWDFFAGGFGLEKIVGEGCQKLKQAYALQIARRELQKRGLRVTERQLEGGRIQLIGRAP